MNKYKGYPFKTIVIVASMLLIAFALYITKDIITLAFLMIIPNIIESLDDVKKKDEDETDDIL